MDNKAFLKLDIPTRWNSAFLMLKSANIYEKMCTRLDEENIIYISDLSE